MADTCKDQNVNRQHKDRLFRFIFKDKAALLSLYNAVNSSDYQDPDELVVYTMEDYVYMGMKNDLSFLIDWRLNIYEHQSTYNPNMPLRGFLYLASAFRKYIEQNRLDIYSSTRLTLPIPRCYVFYNGHTEMEDTMQLRLTDSMPGEAPDEQSCAQFTVTMVNINAGHSPEIMRRCPLLSQYSIFVEEFRRNMEKTSSLREAVDITVNTCIKNNILADILRANRAEVTDMLLTEYDEELHISSEKKISFDEGREYERHKNEERLKQMQAQAEKQLKQIRVQAEEQLKQVQTQAEIQNERHLLESRILRCKLQGKTEEEIAALTKVSLDTVLSVLSFPTDKSTGQ